MTHLTYSTISAKRMEIILGKSGDSGGVMDRVVSQLLAEVDGLDSSNDVFVIGATNRPDLLDPALLRPGRFDRLVYLGVCDTRESQIQILNAITRKMKLSKDVRMEEVAELCPFTFTGADFKALCNEALRKAIRETLDQRKREIDSEKVKEEKRESSGKAIEVEMKHFHEASQHITPSVSERDMEYYRSIQAKFAVQ